MTETARTYGEALYGLSKDEGLSRDMLSELEMCNKLLCENPQFVRLLSLTSVPKKERCDVLDNCFRGKVHEYLLNFMKILVENGTIRELPGCEEVFRVRYYEDNKIMAVKAVSAVPLSPRLEEKLRQKLSEAFGKTIELSAVTDENVLGGLKLEMDGKRYDGTVYNRLQEIKRVLDETVL